MRILSAHQPVYLPGLILFHKIALSDVFVLLPDVQFQRHSWQQRNRVRNGKEAIFLSVPVRKSGDLGRTIRQTEIAGEPWRKKHLTTLKQVYGKRPFFDVYFPAIEALIEADYANLSDLNCALIRHFCEVLELDAEIMDSAALSHEGESQDRLISLCQAAGANSYISNVGAASYVDEAGFSSQGVTHYWQAFRPPEYAQGKAFLPSLSIVDALFNLGPDTARLVRSCGEMTRDLSAAQAALSG
ncbi:WbqC family protein [Oceanicaulis alexandrii]|uniref:WbqC family protein n=1 Tax=Oceanicaulis alexandrii TaxID=153233 RepID=UPI0035CF217B